GLFAQKRRSLRLRPVGLALRAASFTVVQEHLKKLDVVRCGRIQAAITSNGRSDGFGIKSLGEFSVCTLMPSHYTRRLSGGHNERRILHAQRLEYPLFKKLVEAGSGNLLDHQTKDFRASAVGPS